MVAKYFKRYKSMIRASIFFFCVGCGIALCFIRIDCVNAITNMSPAPVTSENSAREAASEVEYAVLILTSSSNEARRDVIRSTWGNFVSNIFIENGEKLYKWNHIWMEKHMKLNLIQLYFVIGTQGLNNVKKDKLKMENSRSKDLLILDDLEDKYANLALKMKLALKWFSHNLKSLKYVIKCDDDSFVRVDLIVKDLEAFAPEMSSPMISNYISHKTGGPTYRGLYWGYFHGSARVQMKSSKWQEKEWFLCDFYLPYALGGGYVLSKSIVDFVAANADFLSCYRSEDVSMAVWTAPLEGINRVHDIRFDTEWKSRGCEDYMLVRHKQTSQDMFQMYKTLVDSQGKNLCKTVKVERISYLYDWNLPPSQCCR